MGQPYSPVPMAHSDASSGQHVAHSRVRQTGQARAGRAAGAYRTAHHARVVAPRHVGQPDPIDAGILRDPRHVVSVTLVPARQTAQQQLGQPVVVDAVPPLEYVVVGAAIGLVKADDVDHEAVASRPLGEARQQGWFVDASHG